MAAKRKHLSAAELKTWHWYRSKGHRPAEIKNILAAARQHPKPAPLDWHTERHSGEEYATWKQGGFTLRAEKHYDQDGDLSYLGEFTNTWKPGCFTRRNAGRGEYKYFMPENTAAWHTKSLLEMKYPRGEAWLLGQQYARQDWKRAEDYNDNQWCYYWVEVTASRAGEELGRASLGGVESDSDEAGYSYFDEVARDLAHEAIAEARAAVPARAKELRQTARQLKTARA